MVNDQVVGSLGNLTQLEVAVIIALDLVAFIGSQAGNQGRGLFLGFLVLAFPATAATAPGAFPGLLKTFAKLLAPITGVAALSALSPA